LNEATGQYEFNGVGRQTVQQRELSGWAQDAWRMRPNLTVNYGFRYDLQFPFVAKNNSYSIGDYDDVFGVSGTGNVFKPGTLPGQPPTFRQLSENERAYPMDWNNVAPSIGVAWTPSAAGGFLRGLTGSEPGNFVVRGGYSVAYSRNGLSDFQSQIVNNPGVSLNVRAAGGNVASRRDARDRPIDVGRSALPWRAIERRLAQQRLQRAEHHRERLSE
jgi:hypothetical protein